MVYLKLVLVMLCWGGTFIATRIAAQTFEPFTGAAFRYLVACLLLIPMAWKKNRRLFQTDGSQFLLLFLMGFSGIFLYSYFFFNGLKLVTASHAALLVALNPSIVLIFSAIWFKEKISFVRVAGILISLIGVALVISRGHLGSLFSNFSLGDAFMLVCPFAWAIYTLVGRGALRKNSPLETSAWASMIGLALLFFSSFSEQVPVAVPFKVWMSLFYLGIFGTVIGFIWYNDGIRALGPTRASIFNNLVPVFAVLLSVLILHEQVSWYTWLGGALVITGVLLTNRF